MTMRKGLAVVTGGSRGIGVAIVKRLAADGYTVLFTYQSAQARAQAVIDAVVEAGGRAQAIRCDQANLADIDALFAAVDAVGEPLAALVNNAAIFEIIPFADVTPDHFERTVAINMRAPLFLAHRAAPRLIDHGRIVFVTSISTRMASPLYPVYVMAKAAVERLVPSLAEALGPRGITVNAVAPGLTFTEMTEEAARIHGDGFIRENVERTALKRIGQPEDIAGIIGSLCSSDGCWVTGQVIDASGGHRL